MNAETAQMFSDDVDTNSIREKAELEKRREYEKFLKEAKCFKDFMLGKEKEYAECKAFLQKYMFNLIQLGGQINTDFLAGMRMVIEMFEELPIKWNNTFEKYGKGE